MKRTLLSHLWLTLAAFGMALSMQAQTHIVVGQVIDKQSDEGIDYATVRLMAHKDSTMFAGTNTNEDGTFTLRTDRSGKVVLRLSYLGYRSIYQDIEIPADADTVRLGRLTMYSDDYVLKAAIVRASVAKVQQVGDTTVFNADAYRTAEGATLEALVKQLPGAEVGDDGSITINGKKVNEVLVNGKDFFKGDTETAMKNLPVNLVKKIKTYDKKSDYAEQTGIDDGEDSFVLDIMTRRELNQSWIANFDAAGGWDFDSRALYSGKLFATRFTDQSRITLIASHNNVGDNGFGGPRGMGGGGGGNGINRNTMVAGNFSWENGKERFAAGRLELGGDVRYTRRDNDTESTHSTENFLTANRPNRSFSNSHSWGNSLSQSANANLRVQWSPDSLTSFSFRPTYSWSKSRSKSESLSAQFDEDPYEQFAVEDVDDVLAQYFNIGSRKRIDQSTMPDYQDFLVNLRDNASRSENYSHNVNANMSLTRRLTGKQGRNLSLTASGGYSTNHSSNYSLANVVTRQRLDDGSYEHHTNNSTWQFTTTPSINWNVRVGGSYVEPIVGKLYGELRYNYSHRFQDQQRTLFNLHEPQSLTDIMGQWTGIYHKRDNRAGYVSDEQPGTTELLNEFLQMNPDDVVAAIRDEQNSQYATYRYDNHSANIGLRYNEGDIRLNAGLGFNPEHTAMDYKKGEVDQHVTRTVFNVSPQVRLRWNMNRTRRLEFNFNSSSSQPSMTNLLEVIDTSNPLSISTGNAGLKPSWNNNLRASFNDYNTDRQQSWAANYSFAHTRNTISTLRVQDIETGRTFSAPQNISGHWNTSAGLMFNSGLGQEKLWNVSTRTDFRFNHNTAYVSTNLDLVADGIELPSAPYTNEEVNAFFRKVLPSAQTSVGRTTNLSENLTLSYRQSLWDVSANGRVNYQHSRSTLQGANNMDTWGFDYGVTANMTLDCGFSLSTDIRMNSRRGYSAASMNTNELIWNAQLSQSFLKDKSLTLSLQFYDILQQQSNVSRTINATMRSDSWNMALNSYAMLHLIYKLKVFAGTKGGDDSKGRGSDEPGAIMRGTMPPGMGAPEGGRPAGGPEGGRGGMGGNRGGNRGMM